MNNISVKRGGAKTNLVHGQNVLENLLELLTISKRGSALVLGGNGWFSVELPVDGEVGIVPGDGPLMFRCVEGCGLIADMGRP
jgi:hypothetical protein